MKLYAISDLHLGHAVNRQALEQMGSYPDDWLILAGDVGETPAHLEFALQTLGKRFARLLWVPGNHELWSIPDTPGPVGEARYQAMVDLCRAYGVLTPEDPYQPWPGEGPPCLLAPLFLLYDYSFRPDGLPLEGAVAWAAETGVLCPDEYFLEPSPHPSRTAWCQARCDATEARLAAVPEGVRLVLINHFPLRQDLVHLRRIPRFSIWCGTTRTADGHRRFPASGVVSGHLHIRTTQWMGGGRFEEVSVGYPRQWEVARGMDAYLREILPGPPMLERNSGPVFHGR